MTKKEKQKIIANIRKKDNMSYWDDIDELTRNFVNELLKKSYCEITYADELVPFIEDDDEYEYEYEDDEIVPVVDEDILWDVTTDVRDRVIAFLEKEYKAFFPDVDECY